MPMRKLGKIFDPKTIAVIGASDTEGKVGYTLMKNLLSGGYRGKIYPVNINRDTVQGLKSYHSITDINDEIDLAIIATPAKTVPSIAEECGKKKAGGLVIISAGFKEAGEEGNKLYEQLTEIIKKYNLRVIGPNCLGFMRPKINLNASFANKMPLKGRVAFISQSGALGTAILDWSIRRNIGFSYFVSIGSMADVEFHDLIDFFGKDPETNSILIYMESLTNARKFLSAARAFAITKPIIILKVGKSSQGSKAAKSHTGSITGNDSVFDAAFKRAGIIRVNTIGELFDSAKTLDTQERPKGKKLAIITNAGGPAVIATDYLIENGGELAELSQETIDELNKILPGEWSKGNPIDILGDASPEMFKKAVELCYEEKGVDGILVILTPQAMTDPSEAARQVISVPNTAKKTILTSWMGDEDVKEGRDILRQGGIPVYRMPENAVRCFMNLYTYTKNLEQLYETPASIPHAFMPKTEENRKLINKLASENRYSMTEQEAKELLSNYGIPTAISEIAKTAEEAAKAADRIGFPAAMKISSPDIIHKTDAGGVELNINSEEEAKKAFERIISSVKQKNPEARIEGALVEGMISKKYELIIGCSKDQIFGPAIVFGMGGVAVEIFKDTNIGLPPLNMALAMRLIEETKIYKLLKGYRGMKGVDITSIQYLLYKFAYLVMDFPEIKELDINPFGVDENGGVVLDAKVVLDEKVIGKKTEPYSHMVISPYPKEYIKEDKLKNGGKVIFRPIKPEDEQLESEMFRNISEDTQRFRFFQKIKDITHNMLVQYTCIDYDREIAMIAETEQEGQKKMAGVVRLIEDPYDRTAEFSLIVADQWQGQGLGSKLTDVILDIAKKRKLKKVYAEYLPDNNPMEYVFKKRGFKMERQGDVMRAELQIEKDNS